MISDELKAIKDDLEKKGKMHFLEGAKEEEILDFEEKSEIHLPKKYREWLMISDGGEFFLPAGVQMYGVAHKPHIDVNDEDRPDEKYIVIGALSSGDPVLCEKECEKISIYNREEDCIEDDEVYDDFFAFLIDLYDLLGIGE